MPPLRTRLTALFVLALLGAPGAAGIVVALHLAHHHHDDPHHAADFGLPLHGHRHADDTAEHSHPVLLAARASSHAPTGDAPALLPVALRGVAWNAVPPVPPGPSPCNAHAPPSPPGTRLILRI